MDRQRIIDFCLNCGKLTELRILQIDNDVVVVCVKCNTESYMDEYTGTLFGIEIDDIRARKRDKKRKMKEQEKRIEALSCKDEIVRNLQCQICLNCADLEVNLQCINCMKTYCFDCLIKWLLENSACPNCRTLLTRDNIKPNKEWKRFIDILEIKQKKPLCDTHQEECNLYCTYCWKFICHKCIVDNIHSNHRIVDIDDAVIELSAKTNSELFENKSVLEKLKKSAKVEELRSKFNLRILDEAIGNINEEVAKIRDKFKYESINLSEKRINKLNISSNELNSNEETLRLFNDTKEWNLIKKASRFVVFNQFVRRNAKITHINPHNRNLKYDLINEESPIEEIFLYPVRELNEYKNGYINLNTDPKVEINFIKSVNDQKITARIAGYSKYQCYVNLELEENSTCDLIGNEIKKLCGEKEELGELKIKPDREISEDKKYLKFKLSLLKINERIVTALIKTETFLIKSINENLLNNLIDEKNKLQSEKIKLVKRKVVKFEKREVKKTESKDDWNLNLKEFCLILKFYKLI